MAADYRQMWTELGLDLPSHDALLGVLGQAYGIFIWLKKIVPRGCNILIL